MKKLILFFALCCVGVGSILAQCNNTSSFGSATIPTTNAVTTISTVSYAGEYSTISGAVSGTTLQFTSSVSTDFITIRSGSSSGPVLAFGQTPLSFANTFSGTLYAHWNTNATCGAQSVSRTTTVQCTSCPGIQPAPDPCLNVGTATCGVSQTTSLASVAGAWNVTSCGFSTPGDERVYTFTAPYTGVYTLNTTALTGGYIDWFFKPTSAGCSSTGWTCIDDIGFTGSVTFNLTAGTYYILADAEGATARSQTWNISCVPPVDPCNTLGSIACGVTQTVSLTGSGGGWNPASCGFSTPGAEQVYTFTAPLSGNYTLNVSNGTGGYIDWFFKPTSAGCGPTGWTCIDDIFSSGNVSFTLAAGTYYILADGEGTTARTQDFSITCASNAPSNDLCSGAAFIQCGSTVTGSTANASPDAAPSCNGFAVGTGGGVWYKLVGNGGFITVSLCNSATTYDTKLHVYEGSCANPLCVTADDDGCTSPTLASTVTFCSQANTVYYVLVNGFLSAAGSFQLSVDCTPPTLVVNPVSPLCVGDAPVTLSANLSGGVFSGNGVSGNTFNPATAGPGTHTITYTLCSQSTSISITVNASPANDLVENAELLACGNSVSGNTQCATSETLGTCGTTDGTGGGVWYRIVGNGNIITATTCNAGTDFDTKLRVFTGSPSSLSCVTGNDDFSGCTTGPGIAGFKSLVSWCSVAGQDYYVLVHGFSTAEGNFTLETSCSAVAPTLTCATGPLTNNLDANCQFVVADYTSLTTATDDCGTPVVTQSPAAGSVLTGAGTYTINFVATDGGGSTATCSIDLVLTDVTAPVASCQNYTAHLDVNGSFTLSAGDINNGSSDACGIASATIPATSYGCSDVGQSYLVTLTVTDVNGNSSACTATVNVVDDIAPVITCPANITVTAPQGQCNTTVSYEVTASDACGATVAVNPASGSVFGLGNTTVNAVATDPSGNTSTCSFNVHVNGDGIITLWGVPCDRTVNCNNVPAAPAIVACPTNNGGGGSGSGSGSGSGHHGWGSGSGSGHHGSGSGSGHGCGNQQCNYGNNNGGYGSNQVYNGYNGYVSNECGSGSGSGSGSGHHGSGSGSGSGHHGWGNGSGHGCGNNNTCNVYCVNNSCGVYATSLCGPCPTVTYSEVIVPGGGGGCYTIIRTWTATDTYGNSVSQSQTITVEDNVRPNLGCPNNITVCVPMNNNTGRVVNFNVTATDNCGTPTVTASPASGSLFPIGNTWVTVTANDGCGNTRTTQFRVRVERRHNCNSRMAEDSEPEAAQVQPVLAIEAFPNPTSGLVDVEIYCNDCSSDRSYDMLVTDMYGKVITKQEVSIIDGKSVVKLDLSGYSAGMYMINVNNLTTRIMKQ